MAWGLRARDAVQAEAEPVQEPVTVAKEYQAFAQMTGQEYQSQSLEPGALPIAEASDPPAAALLGKDEFFALFKGTFDIAGHVTRLKSLGVGDDPTARPASDAIYDIAAEVPALRWLIQPDGVWMQRAMCIGMFTVPKALAVRAELAERVAAKKPAKQPENDNLHPVSATAIDPRFFQ